MAKRNRFASGRDSGNLIQVQEKVKGPQNNAIVYCSQEAGWLFFLPQTLDLLDVQGTLKSLFQYHNLKASVLLKPVNPKGNQPWIFIGRTWCEDSTHWKRPWCCERLKAGGEGGDRGWDGWMTSQLNEREFEQIAGDSEGKPGVLQSCRHDLATKQQTFDCIIPEKVIWTVTICASIPGKLVRKFSWFISGKETEVDLKFLSPSALAGPWPLVWPLNN